jgi:hypothetical protein
VAGESLYPNAGNHQVNSEWRRGHCSRFVAAECRWVAALHFPDTHRERMSCGEALREQPSQEAQI